MDRCFDIYGFVVDNNPDLDITGRSETILEDFKYKLKPTMIIK